MHWARRDFTVRYRQSLLGAAWVVVQPLFLLVVYGTIFSRVLKVHSTEGGYLAFAFCGLAPWTFVSAVLGRTAGSFVGATLVIRQVYFPRAVIPLAAVGVTIVDLVIATLMLLMAQVLQNGALHLSTLALLPIYLGLVLVMAAVGVVVAVLAAVLRDVAFLIPLLLQALFIVTPVMYPESYVPGHYRFLYEANPLAHLIAWVREAVVAGHWPGVASLVGFPAAGAALLALAAWYCASVERRIPDFL